jgi:hypothetical protein
LETIFFDLEEIEFSDWLAKPDQPNPTKASRCARLEIWSGTSSSTHKNMTLQKSQSLKHKTT